MGDQVGLLVVKMGGAAGVDPEPLCDDVAALVGQGTPLVLVHGGSHESDVIARRLGKPPRHVTSISGHQSRYTDRETLEIFAMVTAGRINKLLVERLQRRGVRALGLSGVDGRLLEGKRKSSLKIVEDGKVKVLHDEWSGVVERVHAPLLLMLLNQGYLPVIAPLAISYAGEMLNVDGDRAAAAVAAALNADTLILLTNVPGLLRAYPDESTLIPHISRADIEGYFSCAQGRMKRKLLGAQEALNGGVRQVILADGRTASPIRQALMGKGTVVR